MECAAVKKKQTAIYQDPFSRLVDLTFDHDQANEKMYKYRQWHDSAKLWHEFTLKINVHGQMNSFISIEDTEVQHVEFTAISIINITDYLSFDKGENINESITLIHK